MQRTLVAACTALSLSACGGGSDGRATFPINQPPVATELCTDTYHGQNITISLTASDRETASQELVYQLPDESVGGALVLQSSGWNGSAYEAVYAASPDADWGRHTIAYTVTDSDGAADTAEVKVIIRPRIMPLGDSITTGMHDGRTEPAGYRDRLWTRLVDDGYRVDFVGSETSGTSEMDRNHEGKNGIRSRSYPDGYDASYPDGGIGEQIDSWLTRNPADLILLHIGTNDLQTGKTPDQVHQGIQQILTNIRDWAGAEASVTRAEVLLAQIIGADEPSAFTNADVLRLNRDLLPEFEGDGVKLVDQYAALDRDGNGVPDADLYANQLHPDRDGYEAMADAWYEKLEPVLAEARCPAPL